MKKRLISIVSLFVAVTCALALQGQDFAKEFLRKQADTSTCEKVYVCFADSVLHTNSTLGLMSGFDELDEDTKEELSARYTLVLDKVSDSILLYEARKGFVSKLGSFGLKVVVCTAGNMPTTLKENEHALNIAQFELEESVENDSIVADDGAKHIVYPKLLNAVSWNTWLVYSTAEATDSIVFFADEKTQDYFEGFIEKERGNYFANYDIVKINPNDAYILARQGGETCARYFFNYLINRYVWIKSEGNPTHYYGVDAEDSFIYDDEPFENFDVIGQN